MPDEKFEAATKGLDLRHEDAKMAGATSQNGWGVILDEDRLRQWNIPGSGRTLRLRGGPAGYVLAWVALWYHEAVERLDEGVDDWGWSPRHISGTEEWSNHASATAIDLNADRHPYGRTGTFRPAQVSKIHAMMARLDDNADRTDIAPIRWGGDYNGTKDEMHFEFNDEVLWRDINELAQYLRSTKRGKRLTAANNS